MLYKKEVAKRAKAEVEAGLKEDAPAEDDEAIVIETKEATSPTSPTGKKGGLGAD